MLLTPATRCNEFNKINFAVLIIIFIAILLNPRLGFSMETEDDILLFIPAIISGTLKSEPIEPIPCQVLNLPSRIEQPFTISSGCHLINQSMTVSSRLTISPGTELRFAENTQITVRENGSLYAVGGFGSNRIVMTGQSSSPGFWRGIRYSRSTSLNNRLENVLISYAGDLNCAAVCGSDVFSSSTVAFKNLSVTHSSSYGMLFREGVVIRQFENVQLFQNNLPIRLEYNQVGSLGTNSSFVGNTNNYIAIGSTNGSGRVVSAQTWNKQNVPYHLNGVLFIDTELTIAPGVEIRVNENKSINVSNDGVLRAVGSESERIIFTAQDSGIEGWRGIQFRDSDNPLNQLAYVNIENALGLSGSCGGNNVIAALCFDSISGKNQISFSELLIKNSNSYGLAIDNKTQINDFSSVTFKGNKLPLRIPANLVHHLDKNSDFSGNEFDRIDVGVTSVENDIEQTQFWKNLHAPYQIIHSIDVLAGWTIEAGAELRFTGGTSVRVRDEGFLNAIGTDTHRVRFTGSQEDTPGHWRGISVRSDNEHNVLDYVSLSDAGGSSSSANLDMVCFDSDRARMTVTNSTIYQSAAWGIDNDRDCDLTLLNNEYWNNALGNVKLPN